MHRASSRYASAAAAAADDALLRQHAPVIERAARRLAARTAGAVAPEDLWSAGAVGLLDAARRFDAGRDVKFETFVEHRIKGAMLDELRRLDHLPRRLRTDLDTLERTRASLGQQLGREPESDELAAQMGLPLEDLDALQALGLPQLSVMEELASDFPATDDEAIRNQTVRTLAAAIERLPERLRVLLGLHYDEGLTYREIARVLEVSEPRVCQLHGDALRQLRAAMQESAAA